MDTRWIGYVIYRLLQTLWESAQERKQRKIQREDELRRQITQNQAEAKAEAIQRTLEEEVVRKQQRQAIAKYKAWEASKREIKGKSLSELQREIEEWDWKA